MAVLGRWALAHLVGAALADALPGSMAAPTWMSAAVEVVSWYGEHWRTWWERRWQTHSPHPWLLRLGRAQLWDGDAGAASTGAPSGSGVGSRTPCFPAAPDWPSEAVEVAVLVHWALANLVGAALAGACPGSLAAPAWTSATGQVAVLVRWTLAHLLEAALVDTLPASVAAPAWTRNRCGCGGAGAVGAGAPSGRGVGGRTPCLYGCSCCDEGRVDTEVAVLVRWVLARLARAALADTFPAALATPERTRL
jgi:hypothetical protein